MTTSYLVHQSDLQSWNRCPAEFAYDRQGYEGDTNSAIAFGTVIHYAMMVLETTRDLDRAIKTFLYYWHPLNIDQLTQPVPKDGWLPKQDYNSLRQRGCDALRAYADRTRHDDHELLALEMPFVVPVRGTPHYLAGTVDRLAARWHRRIETLNIDDYKSGKQKWNLRFNVQGHAYAYATMQPEFWTGTEVTGLKRPFRDELVDVTADGFASQGDERVQQLMERFGTGDVAKSAPRRFTWINLQQIRWIDGGYREQRDYDRFRLAVEQVTASIEAGIFPLRIDGETCTYCTYRHVCGGIGVPDGGLRVHGG